MKIDEFTELIKGEISENKEVRVVMEIAQGIKQPLYLVGGFLRDTFLGRKNFDLDFIVKDEASSIAKKVAEKFRAKLIVMDKEHIVNYRVVKRGLCIDFAEIYQGDIHSDLGRRDFTINSIAYSFIDSRLYDDFNGLVDLEKNLIRMVSVSAFDNDPLRMLRAVRYFTTLKGFQIEKNTLDSIISKKTQIGRSSSERIKNELDKIILSDYPFNGLILLLETGLINSLFSSKGFVGIEKGLVEKEENAKTIDMLRTMDEMLSRPLFQSNYPESSSGKDFQLSKEDEKILLYSAIVFSLIRGSSFSLDSDIDKKNIFIALKNMRFSNTEILRICKVIENLKFLYKLIDAEDSETQIRRMIYGMGRDVIILLYLGISILKVLEEINYTKMLALGDQILAIFQKDGNSIISPRKLIDGRDVMDILRCREGEKIGRILKEIRKLQIENKIATRKEAIEFLQKIKLEYY